MISINTALCQCSTTTPKLAYIASYIDIAHSDSNIRSTSPLTNLEHYTGTTLPAVDLHGQQKAKHSGKWIIIGIISQ